MTLPSLGLGETSLAFESPVFFIHLLNLTLLQTTASRRIKSIIHNQCSSSSLWSYFLVTLLCVCEDDGGHVRSFKSTGRGKLLQQQLRQSGEAFGYTGHAANATTATAHPLLPDTVNLNCVTPWERSYGTCLQHTPTRGEPGKEESLKN